MPEEKPELPPHNDRLRIGGSALHNGVLLQSERFWAVALRGKDDAIILESGEKAGSKGREGLYKVPFLRGLTRLGENLAMMPYLSARGSKAALPTSSARVIIGMIASALGTFVLRSGKVRMPLALQEVAVSALALIPALLSVKNSELARYHGAEHKTIAAYETFEGDIAGMTIKDTTLAHKEHQRCGSNLVGPSLASLTVGNLATRSFSRSGNPLLALGVGLFSLSSSIELFRWMDKNRETPLARALSWPGLEMQRLFTTQEPTQDQLEVALAALRELLRLEAAERPA